MTVFFVTLADDAPDWCTVPPEYDSIGIVQHIITGKINYVRVLIKHLTEPKPVLLGMALDDTPGEDRYPVIGT